ncbi:uncharacterized protein KRP23_7127 [Phytophthora ramorum]|nr:hypothetical protein KRP23_7127 [Phytophthora ramorum]
MRHWSFHAQALASGMAEREQAAKTELLNILGADATLSSWQRSCSYRVVGRVELEELVQATHAEEETAAAAHGEDAREDTDADAEEEKQETTHVEVTPPLLALAFQHLVSQDKRQFLAHQQSHADAGVQVQSHPESALDEAQTPSRIYFLVDYPSSLPEINALLRLGEVGCAAQVTDNPETLPLLPLIDGVLLLADPSSVSTERGRNGSGPTNLPQNRGVVKGESGDQRMSMMETSVFQGSNAVVKIFHEAAQVGGIEWSDFTFTNVGSSTETSAIKQSEELVREVFDTVETLAAQKIAVVRLYQAPLGLVWLTVYHHGETFGLRSGMQGVAKQETHHNGVYYFDFRQGRFQLCDNEQNQFHVDFSGTDDEAGPTVSVDLAGVVSDTEAARYNVDSIPAKAVINEPIQPHIFILNGDGTGVEILRPRDIMECIESTESENQMDEIMNGESSSTRHHVFLRRISAPGDGSRWPKPLFNDEKLHEEMLRLQRPVATAGKYLPSYFTETERALAQQQFTMVRRVEQIRPLSADELNEMHAGWNNWEQWQLEREANKECYKVEDPRQSDVIAQEAAMQKKVLAAYKATRARKKMARQKAREMKANSISQELSPALRMETVQEGEETVVGGGEDEDESNDEFGQFGSDMSDDDVGETVEMDDPMELLWSAFSQADTESRGRLSIAQTRLGVVNVLGLGVTTNELTEALVRFKISYPFNVSFDVFADLVAFFRKGGEDNQDPEGFHAGLASRIPSLKDMAPEQHKSHGTPRAAGSAAEAIRAKHINKNEKAV